jgi:hypothetical protein
MGRKGKSEEGPLYHDSLEEDDVLRDPDIVAELSAEEFRQAFHHGNPEGSVALSRPMLNEEDEGVRLRCKVANISAAVTAECIALILGIPTKKRTIPKKIAPVTLAGMVAYLDDVLERDPSQRTPRIAMVMAEARQRMLRIQELPGEIDREWERSAAEDWES